jgi:iron complex outermembrane receptor protein
MRIHSSRHYGEILWAEVYPQGYQPNVRYHDYAGKSNTFTVYAHEKYSPLEKVILMASLQYQRHNYRLEDDKRYNVTFDRDYDFVSPRFGVTYKFTDYANIYTSISTASRQPTLYDIYNPQDFYSNPEYRQVNFVQNGSQYEYVGKELNPEKLFDIELGGDFRKDLGDVSVRGDVNLYRMEIRDELVPYAGQIDDMNLPIAGNAEKTIHQGIELSALASLDNGLSFGGNFSLNDDHFDDYKEFGWDGSTIDLSGNRIGGFPEMMLYYMAKYRVRKFNIIVDGKYRGKQFIDNAEGNELESYNVLNGTVIYDLGSRVGFSSLKASLRIQNLLDKEYVQAGYADWTDGFPRYLVGAERNFFLSLELGI